MDSSTFLQTYAVVVFCVLAVVMLVLYRCIEAQRRIARRLVELNNELSQREEGPVEKGSVLD